MGVESEFYVVWEGLKIGKIIIIPDQNNPLQEVLLDEENKLVGYYKERRNPGPVKNYFLAQNVRKCLLHRSYLLICMLCTVYTLCGNKRSLNLKAFRT